MKIKFYQVDAFTSEMFGGNPAGVCPLDEWIPEASMQLIATENNLSETAFFVDNGKHFEIRWFTPEVEINLCGHATLASGHVLFNHLGYPKNEIVFSSISGELKVSQKNGLLALDFPTNEFKKITALPEIIKGLGLKPIEVYLGSYCMAVVDNEANVRDLNVDFQQLLTIDANGIIVTAKGDEVDFVSRFFAPRMGINEDPVTGSAHTYLIPYWANKLGKNELSALQLSKRGGELYCKLIDKRVEIMGHAVTYMEGEIFLAE